MYFILLLALSIGSSSAYAEDAKKAPEKDHKKQEREICLENCRQKTKELPTCRDAACKKDNQEQIKKCEDACESKGGNESPCVSKCIDSAKAQEGPCSENPTCLKNITGEFQTCVQVCKSAEPPVGWGGP